MKSLPENSSGAMVNDDITDLSGNNYHVEMTSMGIFSRLFGLKRPNLNSNEMNHPVFGPIYMYGGVGVQGCCGSNDDN